MGESRLRHQGKSPLRFIRNSLGTTHSAQEAPEKPLQAPLQGPLVVPLSLFPPMKCRGLRDGFSYSFQHFCRGLALLAHPDEMFLQR